MSRTIAAMAIVTGIPPNELLECDPEIFAEMVKILNKQNEDRGGS